MRGGRIREIITGLMLGDGHAERRGGKTRLTIKQGEKNKEYIRWLHEEFKKVGMCSGGELKKRKWRNKEGKEYWYRKFNTYSSEELNIIRDKYYDGRRKVLPKEIVGEMTPLAMAVWLGDEGFVHNGKSGFCTDNFSKEEVRLLRKAMSRWGGRDGRVSPLEEIWKDVCEGGVNG